MSIDDIGQGVIDVFNRDFVDKAARDKRFDTCKECKTDDGEPTMLKFYICRHCSCEMAVKTWLTNSKCPLNKWQ